MAERLELLLERIHAKLAELNLSEREASIDATGKPDAIRYIRTRSAMPSAERLDQLARTLQTTPAWLMGGSDGERAPDAETPFTPETLKRLPRNLPIYGTALGADLELTSSTTEQVAIEQTEIDMSQPIDYMARPTVLAGRKKLYVVTVAGHSMEPRFDAGRRVLVDPMRPARVGDDVIIQLRSPQDDGERITAVLIKQLVRRKAGAVVLRQFNPGCEFEIAADRVCHVHVIVPWDDVLSL